MNIYLVFYLGSWAARQPVQFLMLWARKKLSFEIAFGLNGRVWVYFLRHHSIAVWVRLSPFSNSFNLLLDLDMGLRAQLEGLD